MTATRTEDRGQGAGARVQKYPTPLHAEVDGILKTIGHLTEVLELGEAEAEARLADLKRVWQVRLAPTKNRLELMEKSLVKLMKVNQGPLFDGRDLVDLPHGRLLHSLQEAVKKARGVLERLEALGWEEALKRVVTVNWAVLEGWPEERLIACGTERLKKEVFAYEVKKQGPGARGQGADGPA